jgi:WD40 repeat protein
VGRSARWRNRDAAGAAAACAAAANAATILNWMGESLAHQSWAGVWLDGADLTGANLTGTCLAGASLRGVRLERACLRDVDLRGADLEGAVFGELAPQFGNVGRVTQVAGSMCPTRLVTVLASADDNGGVMLRREAIARRTSDSSVDNASALLRGHSMMPPICIQVHKDCAVTGLALAPASNGRLLLGCLGGNGALCVLDAVTGEVVVPAFPVHSPFHGGSGVAFGVCPTTRQLLAATCSRDGTVRLWNAETGAPVGAALLHSAGAHPSPVTCVAFETPSPAPSASGAASAAPSSVLLLAAGGRDGVVTVWDAGSGAVLARTSRLPDMVSCVALSRSPRTRKPLLAVGCWDHRVRVFNAYTCLQVGRDMRHHNDEVTSVALAADGPRLILASGSMDGRVAVCDADTCQLLGVPYVHGRYVSSVAYIAPSPGETRSPLLASGSWDGSVRQWHSLQHRREQERIVGHSQEVTCVALGGSQAATDPLVAVSGSADGSVRVWDAVTGRPLCEPLLGHKQDVTGVAVGELRRADGGMRVVAVSTSRDNTVRPLCEPLLGHKQDVTGVAVGELRRADGGMRVVAVSTSRDNTVRLWDTQTGALLGVIDHPRWVTCVAVGSPVGGGLLLAFGSTDRGVHLCHLAPGWPEAAGSAAPRPLRRAHGCHVTSVAFAHSPEGRLVLATGSSDKTARCWDVEAVCDGTGEAVLIATFTGHRRPINSVALRLCPKTGKLVLATGSRDRSVRLWNALTGSPLTWCGLICPDGVTSVSLGVAGGRLFLAAGCWDNVVRVVDVWMPSSVYPSPTTLEVRQDGGVLAVAFAPRAVNGRLLLASGYWDHSLRVWATTEVGGAGALAATSAPTPPTFRLAFSTRSSLQALDTHGLMLLPTLPARLAPTSPSREGQWCLPASTLDLLQHHGWSPNTQTALGPLHCLRHQQQRLGEPEGPPTGVGSGLMLPAGSLVDLGHSRAFGSLSLRDRDSQRSFHVSSILQPTLDQHPLAC